MAMRHGGWLAMAVVGCTSEPGPPHYVFAPDESILAVQDDGTRKSIVHISGQGTRTVGVDLPLNSAEGGRAAGGDLLVAMGPNRFVYCGADALRQFQRNCWRVTGETTEEIGQKIFPNSLSLLERETRSVGVGSDGSWWIWQGKLVERGVSFEADPRPELSLGAKVRHAVWTPTASRWAVVVGDAECVLEVFDTGKSTASWKIPVACRARPHWSHDGQTLAYIDQDELWRWTAAHGAKRVSERLKGPDGAHESVMLLAVSPDGNRAWVASTRHSEAQQLVCAGVSVPVFRNYVVTLRDGTWRSAPGFGGTFSWTHR